ncbi:MAG: primosomal protein N' [bacterium]|nr:primosomal protein N' [bacterium]
MTMQFADIIVDISHEKLDKIFQYRIPPELLESVTVGRQVWIPFGKGNRRMTGYVVGIRSQADYPIEKMKNIAGVVAGAVSVESRLIALAWWMKERYGATMNQTLKTVIPVKRQVKQQEKKNVRFLGSKEELTKLLEEARRRHYTAREKLLAAFLEHSELSYDRLQKEQKLTPSVLKPLLAAGKIEVITQTKYRNPLTVRPEVLGKSCELNAAQAAIVEDFTQRWQRGDLRPSLLYGITGSGKTEVYMECMERVLREGKQVIVLIPEIALTYQNMLRFYQRFGNTISILNSRLSAGERYDQMERAKKGEIQIMIGPRSALFTPFPNLGLIVMDEEHEAAYKSETAPRYHARETAVQWALLNHAALLLGSATPSLTAYTRALQGQYHLYRLTERARPESKLARVQVVDLRKELQEGNKSVFSRTLYQLMEEKLQKGEQIILFMNRRGYSNFISCRSCGEAIKCPHCDVSLTYHRNQTLHCHYCGFQMPLPKICPHCASPYLAGFGSGTQKIEETTRKWFPQARVLRMDLDTTTGKHGHEDILAAFHRGEADILIGTQMIVKGHDFPRVTLMGILAADISLYAPDYRSAETTFALLTQAAGRAGRADVAGDVVIQSYQPEHYSIQAAAKQDYEGFYEREMSYRRLLHYPPSCTLLTLLMTCEKEELLTSCSDFVEQWMWGRGERGLQIVGPTEASIYKINDIYRKILYLKHENYAILLQIKEELEAAAAAYLTAGVQFQFDFQG